ncbi:precorrin-6y C5,15-methyltransferase (decarboxylating) subunit CbiE [Fodinisporobacter ferrooxydans]|uniref:Precorrin-6y C5,15-methyltransferase (Decarboxylating) subunit CbiE n=1 Tax=Fodinisporobacter ferrooxydans TaxID=2901836 RepID=A0ABY4CHA4_9BACL|nr:precorrin-6y C5,15-methyltransferase (decarboxylating) subunit CbiE [Alicyclobacillaceae bacterium MYW30-H2]
MDKWMYVIGIGDDGEQGLFPESIDNIRNADVLVGGDRQLAFFPDFAGEKIVLRAPLTKTVEELQAYRQEQRVVVLASGDPLFYGIGSYLVKKFGAGNVAVYPHLSSIQLAFARCGEAWQDARIISLHGRPILGFAQKLNGAEKAAVLTDDKNTPSAIANYLLQFEMTEYDVFVCENLGSGSERTAWYSLKDLVDQEFSPLNVVVLKRRPNQETKVFPLGIEDGQFSQRKPDRGLITKREIRVLSLAELQLPQHGVLWDIGACTGSVSIEAVHSQPCVRVFAIEKNAEDLVNLRENQVKFRADFVAVHGRAPDRLDEFDDPDAVFIGGSGGELEDVLHVCAVRLKPQGRIVINAATIETLYLAQQKLQQLDFHVSITLVQTARSKPILHLTRFEGMNPVYLITAWRTEKGQGEQK